MDAMHLNGFRCQPQAEITEYPGGTHEPAGVSARPEHIGPTMQPGTGYGARAPRWRVLTFVVALHVAATAVPVTMRYDMAQPEVADRLTIFDIAQPSPSPPPQPIEVQQAVTPTPAPVAAPDPAVRLTRESPIPVASIRPAQQRSVALNIPAPPSAPAAPSQEAQPAPVSPPDFKAAQLNNPGPDYPYLSRRAREEGVVVLRVLVSTDGRAKTLEIEDSSGHRRLDDAALKTVKQWRFVPASQAGAPLEAWVLVPVTFQLG